jgi:hypothetical protein
MEGGPVHGILGRDAELAEVKSFIGSGSGGPSALLLEGTAGIGKTTLWRAGVSFARARGHRVLSCRAAESEARLSYAALGDLFDFELPDLPAPQQRALDAALLRAELEGAPPDQRAVSLASLGVLRALAASAPVIIAIDDVQWLDAPSARVLAFVVRRLEDAPIRILVALRVGSGGDPLALGRAGPAPSLHRVSIGPLREEAMTRLLRARAGGDLTHPILLRLHRISEGNPFFALEIARALTEQGVRPAPGEPLPVRAWLVELSRQQPVVLVLDDLHWASKPVLLLLRHVLRAAVAEGKGVRLLVLGTYRDTELGRNHALAGVMADVRRLPGVEQLAMAGLSAVEVAELLSQAAGHELDDDGRRLAESLHAETEGNPFFVGEVLRHLAETGMVRRQDERRVVARGGSVAVPEGVRDVVGRRLGRLSAQTNQMLSVAAVLGRDFDVELLAALRDVPEDSLLDALDEAVWAGLVQETGADRYRFAHVLVRATLVAELSVTRRRRLHRRVGEALEKLRPDDVAALAYHFSQAGPDGEGMSRAVRYGLAAAEQALQARALGDAEARFHQVLGLLDDPAAREAPARIAALCGLGEAQRDQGNAEFRTTLLEAGWLAQASADPSTLVRAALANSRGLPSMIGAVDSDRVAITEAALASVGERPTAERARLLAHLAAELCFAGDDQRRVALSDEAEAIARGLGDHELLAWVLNRTGYAAFAPDRVERLVARGEEATRLSDAAGDPAQRVLSRYHWSGALLTAGDLPGFRAVTEAVLAVSSDAAPTIQRFAQFVQARVSLMDGRFDEAQRINDDVLGQAQDLGEPDGPSWWASIAMAIEMLRGGIAAVVDAIGDISSQYPDFPAWWITHAVVLAMVGRAQEARDVLARHSPDPDELINDVLPFMAVSWLAWVPFHLDDARLAGRIAATLRPYRDYWAHPYSTVLGPVTIYLALCAATTGDLDESVALFEESDRVLAELGCHGLLPFLRLTHAEVLLRRAAGNRRTRAMQLLDQVRRGAAAIQAPNLVAQADELTVRLGSEAGSWRRGGGA